VATLQDRVGAEGISSQALSAPRLSSPKNQQCLGRPGCPSKVPFCAKDDQGSSLLHCGWARKHLVTR